MDKELAYILMMTAGVLLWTLGGYRWKGFRRFILGPVLCALLLVAGFRMWQAILTGLLTIGVAHLGYGENSPWWKKILTALSYNLPSLVFGWTWWLVLQPIIFLGTFALSNTKATEKDFVWKVCEGIAGLIFVVTIISATQRPWGG